MIKNYLFLRMTTYHHDLLPEKLYHIYTRANGDEKLFLSDENYRFFLSKFRKYISPVADVSAWVLLPNHFHFLLHIKDLNTLMNHYNQLNKKVSFSADLCPKFIMQCFGNLLNSYTKSFNKVYKRKGSLFIDYLRRIEIQSDTQMGATAFYIHKNPVHHGYTNKMEYWKWSSYNSYLNKAPQEEASVRLLEWFGGQRGFREYHSQPVYLKGAVAIED